MNKKFIAFGCKSNSSHPTSTHGPIHYAYRRAFEHLGWESHWLDNQDIDNFDFSNSVILTIGGYEHNLPIRKDCKYILHNCNLDRYKDVIDNCLILQVFTNDVYKRDVEKIDDFVFYQKDKSFGAPVLYQPWATDLLPNEINLKDKLNFSNNRIVYWVGSIWNDYGQGNTNEIEELKKSLLNRNISFEQKSAEFSGNKEIINQSYISPALQGKWQCEKGYIPCRIFKNISYGEFGITNSKYVSELFNDSIVYDSNIDNMIEKSLETRDKITLDGLNKQIKFVKENHTYINRIKNILDVL